MKLKMFINKTKMFCFITLQVAILSAVCQANTKTGEFTLQGEVTGLNSGSILMYYQNVENKSVIGFLKIKNGEFVVSGQINKPTLAYLIFNKFAEGKNYQDRGLIVLEPGNLHINLTVGSFFKAKVIGSEGQKFYDQFRLEDKLFVDSFKRSQTAAAKLSTADAKEESLTPKDGNVLFLNVKNVNKVDYVMPNPESIASIVLLPTLVKNKIVSTDSASAILNKLPKSYRLLVDSVETALIQLLKEAPVLSRGKENAIIPFLSRTTENAFIPRIIATDAKGVVLDTHDFAGKYLLVDFWASWSLRSQEVNSELLRIYNKYKGKNIEFLGISPDKDRQAWLKAIDEGGIGKWRNISFSDEVDYKNKTELIKRFGVRVPTVTLYGKSGEFLYSGSLVIEEAKLFNLDHLLEKLLDK